jgi:hypothetical protein
MPEICGVFTKYKSLLFSLLKVYFKALVIQTFPFLFIQARYLILNKINHSRSLAFATQELKGGAKADKT